MKISKVFLSAAVAALLSTGANAAPQSGVWLIENNQNAYGGNIVHIDTQDNKVFVMFAAGEVPSNTYFLLGTGTLNGDNIAVDLVSSKDGSTRRINGRFDSSTRGVIDFPGVGSRTLSRAKLNDETVPESFYGVWSFSYISAATDRGASSARKFVSKIQGTANGTGIAVDTSGRFGCEYQRSGASAGYTVCVEVSASGSLIGGYTLKRSVSHADGVYFDGVSSDYIGVANKLLTNSGNLLLMKEQVVPHANIAYQIETLSSTFKGGRK